MSSKCGLLLIFLATTAVAVINGLQCYQCGQYNDGVGSITPCLNYSAPLAHIHLKDCPRASDKFCIKYVSELSTVRDCVEYCTEKEVWNTRTYCCNEDSCNGTYDMNTPSTLALLLPVISLFTTVIIRRH